ncbi:protein DPCD [Tribolium madens]|uniref:protein DPCD n=1 Tax=Tribolium madens TaxID=41895 RepID=UPI001CF749A5|nr:protein DPCD [Tribolium madens]
MMDWLTQLKNAKKSCMVQNNLKKVHYDFGSGKEMVEEYNMDTNVVTRRAWKVKGEMGGEGEWDIELGDPEVNLNKEQNLLIRENSSQPFVSRRNTRINLEWRIRNLPYPIETYSVTTDIDKKCLVVRTTNKKYFKILRVPELDRLCIVPQQEAIQIAHKYNTLIITYKKPKELLEFEKKVLEEVNKIQPKNFGDMDCKPS